MKNDKKKKGLYAFNINDMRAKKRFQGSLHDFQKLNRGTYDEIESNDITIKESKAKLKQLKNASVKEFVYTNKDIPDHWKTKLDYEKDVLKTFVNDKNFLFYLGHGGGGDIFSKIKESEKNNSPLLNTLSQSPKEKSSSNKDNNKYFISPVRTLSNKIMMKNNKFKENNNFSDKEILGILDDFKNAYPLFEKEKYQEVHNNKNKKNIIYDYDSERKSKSFYDSKNIKNNNYIQKNNSTNRKNISLDIHSLSSLPSIKQKHNRRQNTFRQNIFTNLLPSTDKNAKNFNKQKIGLNSCTNFRKKKIDYKNNNNIFLYSNDIFDKKININNQTVVKNLEGINFYGPYFSYCPPCGNRNLEFYKNLETNQCLQIIQQIKKNKGKNVIVNNNKNNNLVNKNEQINKNNQELYEKSLKYNSRSLNNNYNESDNNSMIQQMSPEGSDDREKYDMFD